MLKEKSGKSGKSGKSINGDPPWLQHWW